MRLAISWGREQMRASHGAKVGGLAVLLLVLLAGCGGGGGGGTTPSTLGDYTVNYTAMSATYTPGSTAVDYVYGFFEDPAGVKDDIHYVLFTRNSTTGKWTLDLSSATTAFKATAKGEYDMTCYVTAADALEAIRVGPKYRVTLDITVNGGDGPPPPPF